MVGLQNNSIRKTLDESQLGDAAVKLEKSSAASSPRSERRTIRFSSDHLPGVAAMTANLDLNNIDKNRRLNGIPSTSHDPSGFQSDHIKDESNNAVQEAESATPEPLHDANTSSTVPPQPHSLSPGSKGGESHDSEHHITDDPYASIQDGGVYVPRPRTESEVKIVRQRFMTEDYHEIANALDMNSRVKVILT